MKVTSTIETTSYSAWLSVNSLLNLLSLV